MLYHNLILLFKKHVVFMWAHLHTHVLEFVEKLKEPEWFAFSLAYVLIQSLYSSFRQIFWHRIDVFMAHGSKTTENENSAHFNVTAILQHNANPGHRQT
jgi:hypothetical protein